MNIIPAEHAHRSIIRPSTIKCCGSNQPATIKTWHENWHGLCPKCETPWKLDSEQCIPAHNKH